MAPGPAAATLWAGPLTEQAVSVMYSDMIIGFDGSASGRDALALGRRLAQVTDAHATVVCVHPRAPVAATIAGDRAADVGLAHRRGRHAG